MPEVLNTSNIIELTDGMNFETELYKTKMTKPEKEEKVKSGKMKGLIRRLFHLNLKSFPKSFNGNKSVKENKNSKNKKMKKKDKKMKKLKSAKSKKTMPFEQERLEASWNEITKKESKKFHKMDQIAKHKLSKIIPKNLSKKR